MPQPALKAQFLEQLDSMSETEQRRVFKLVQSASPQDQNQRQKAVDLIQTWIDEDDAEEQKETGDYLIRALDEDRPSGRKLFPAHLQGQSW
jgi:hypothetical protein